MVLFAAFIYAELGMCCVRLGVAVNPTSGYGISRGYLVNNKEKRSVSVSRKRLTTLARLTGPQGAGNLEQFGAFLLCVGRCSCFLSDPSFVNKPAVNRGISNMRVYFQEPNFKLHQLAFV